MEPDRGEIGVGASADTSLRVSVATLVRLLFEHPEEGKTILALERTASLRSIEGRPEVIVSAKPFGGGVRLTNPALLKSLIGPFRYDSERSRQDQDFRILIHPSSWSTLESICREHWGDPVAGILDPSAERELVEEFEDSLQRNLAPDQYRLRPWEIYVEDHPVETDSVRAAGMATVRVYYIYEARMQAPELVSLMLDNASRYTDKDLQELASEDARRGGKGRANAILTLALDELMDHYLTIPKDGRGAPTSLRGHRLNGNVRVILGVNR